jgi:hypothetical protein
MLSGLAAESKGQLILRLQDPRANLVRVEVLDAADKVIDSNGRLTLGALHSYASANPCRPPRACGSMRPPRHRWSGCRWSCPPFSSLREALDNQRIQSE